MCCLVFSSSQEDDLIAQEEWIGLSVIDSIDTATLIAVQRLQPENESTIALLPWSELVVCQEPKQVLENKFLMRKAIYTIAMAMPFIWLLVIQ